MRFRCAYKSDKETFKLVWAKHAWNLVCDLTWLFASLTLLLWGTYGAEVSWQVFILPLQVFILPSRHSRVCSPEGCRTFCLLLECHDSDLSREAGKGAGWIASLISRNKFLLVTPVSGGWEGGEATPACYLCIWSSLCPHMLPVPPCSEMVKY